MDYNTVIIGAGVAGMTAAIYLKRANIDVCVIEKEAPGGQILRTANIRNYPGFNSINGSDLAMKIYEQTKNLNVDYQFREVLEIEINQNDKIVKTKDNEIHCQNVIIATGRSARKLELPKEEELLGKGISYCAVCDGNFYKEKKVAVVGGGRSALQSALYLSKICESVVLIHRRDTFRAEDNLLERVKSKENISILTNKTVKKFETENGILSAITVTNQTQDEKIKVDGCFIYIGESPNTSCFKNLEILDEQDCIEIDNHYETKYPGIYAIGDCIQKELYQIITAEAEGAIVADRIIKNR